MKKLLGLLLFLVLSSSLQAQSKEEKEVAAAVESLKKAMLDANRSSLENIAATELTYGHSNGLIEDKAAFVEALASGKADFKSINLTEQTIKLAGNTALVRHKLTGEVVNSGQPGNVNLGVLLVWQKQQGQWKLLARQAFKL
ncbi:nuclear transport factor 2 family protein [Rhodocytophaga aerolata]|uniref:Nuclear transport factor 2 family protein n=1 Tax=Rhodocytophaga aerolata TaxID=455078 RepID=A0ABT8QYF4_9BACT|nr:nuclear transport factor 2 family protein [Rhodocytophaga aerolata]MDO1444870.1 nuclear transport factor 2 family protein [Rhodocytophaga aerolata]